MNNKPTDEKLKIMLSETQAQITHRHAKCIRGGSVEVDAYVFENMLMELQRSRKEIELLKEQVAWHESGSKTYREQFEAINAELQEYRKAQSEPIGYYSAEMPAVLDQRGYASISATCAGECRYPLYAAPQPTPIVPEAMERLRLIVSDPRALPRRKEWISGQQYSYVLLENVEAIVDEAYRAATLEVKAQNAE